MISLMIAIFVLGYACIVLEHKIKIDKAASALVMFGLIWSAYALIGEQTNTSSQLMEHLGSTCETLLFLIGAMTIVDLIDMHGGFYIITKYIKIDNKNTWVPYDEYSTKLVEGGYCQVSYNDEGMKVTKALADGKEFKFENGAEMPTVEHYAAIYAERI